MDVFLSFIFFIFLYFFKVCASLLSFQLTCESPVVPQLLSRPGRKVGELGSTLTLTEAGAGGWGILKIMK